MAVCDITVPAGLTGRSGSVSDDPRTLDPLLCPGSIAVIGASRSPGRIGHQILANLLRHGFTGAVYPVNAHAPAVHGVRAYPSVLDIPDSVDMAVIVVPREHVLDAAEACGRKGVKALVVISAGFREVGGAGVDDERALLDIVRRYGMRLVGPNCMGVLNADPAISMNATFAPTMPPAGSVAFMSQSGALGVTILDHAAEHGIGISQFVSVGNKPDVSGNDLIRYWAADPATRMILMYVENFGNPARFLELAREVTRTRPVVIVKAGRSAGGARAASSHTGALAGSDAATAALLAQAGVIRVDSVEELFELAMAFPHQPLPRGNRVAVITNAGGPGIIIADACDARGLQLAELSVRTRDRLAALLPQEASLHNPVDMIASATAGVYGQVLEAVLEDPAVDAVIAAFVPPLGTRQQDVAEAIVKAAPRGTGKPVLAVLMGREGLPQGRSELQAAGIPGYRFPESAVRALAAMCRQRAWLERPAGRVRTFRVDSDRVTRILDTVAEQGRDRLTDMEALEVLRAYGIPVVATRFASDADAAVRAAEEIGYPVVVKAVSSAIIHKTDVGAVQTALRDAAAVRAAVTTMHADVQMRAGLPAEALDGFLVQAMAGKGHEMIVGLATDAVCGPLLMVGIGGIHVEALNDVVFRLQPLTDQDARDMVRSLRGLPMLQSGRGMPPADLAAVEDVIMRVAQLSADHPEIRELDINPWFAWGRGGAAVDARISIRAASPDTARSGTHQD